MRYMKVGLHHSSVGKAQATKNDKIHKFLEKSTATEFRASFIEKNLERLVEKRRNNVYFHQPHQPFPDQDRKACMDYLKVHSDRKHQS